MATARSGEHFVQEGVLDGICIRLLNLADVRPPNSISDRRLSPQSISRVIEFINEHYNTDLNRKRLAEVAEFEKLAFERYHLEMALWEEGGDYYSTAKRAFQGTDEEFSAAWKEKIKPEWEAAPAQTKRKDRMSEIGELLPKYLDPDNASPRHIDHGYVWFYQGKPRMINEETSDSKPALNTDDSESKITALVSAQSPTEENPIEWGVRVITTESGENVSVACELGVRMAPGFHIGPIPAEAKFEMPTKIDIEFPSPFSAWLAELLSNVVFLND
ncbi:hypothetical protein [Blastopirellula retiformator]|uniref:Uncharacterized protein n=1 Tax=Blastopirellula retiformator TaxID=2527970 RepID=A0A5C5VJI5_9BACT|nr:hypothetical protein [Blastopirellula retiformator]TWT38758.1 hypothetical protein Enr8_04520 [Blastopirellula retiformator]